MLGHKMLATSAQNTIMLNNRPQGFEELSPREDIVLNVDFFDNMLLTSK